MSEHRAKQGACEFSVNFSGVWGSSPTIANGELLRTVSVATRIEHRAKQGACELVTRASVASPRSWLCWVDSFVCVYVRVGVRVPASVRESFQNVDV